VIFIDAIVVKVRGGQVTNKPFYVVVGVTTAGERDILGIWAGDGGEGAKYWPNVLTELKNRGRGRCPDRDLRRAERPTGVDQHRVGEDPGPNV
jgi:transposase-like protein